VKSLIGLLCFLLSVSMSYSIETPNEYVGKHVYCHRWTWEPYHAYPLQNTNIGEFLFAEASKKLVPNASIANNIKDLRADDIYLIVVSNVLNNSAGSGEWANSVFADLKRANPGVVPIVMCMGAQSESIDHNIEIHPRTLELLRLIQEKSIIGVRGEYTERQLIRYGIKSRIVGCPSLFFNPISEESLRQEKSMVQKLAIGTTLYSGNPVQHSLLVLAARHQATYYVQTEFDFHRWQDMSFEDVLAELERFSKGGTKLTYEQAGLVNRYRESKPDHSVFEQLKTQGVSETYFQDFIKLIQTKSFYSKNAEHWIDSLKAYDLVVSSRIHGVVAGLLAGVRSLCVAHDSRTQELCDTLHIPYIITLDPNTELQELYRLADPTEFLANLDGYKANYLDFLSQNKVPVSS
jgi:hypothetical protein